MFLPISLEEVKSRGWDEVDFVVVTGDAYVDHPSFGIAIISRVLEAVGYKVAILAQPNYNNNFDFKRFGKPRLGFLISGGNIDSMVNHYSVSKKRRETDHYTAGGVMGKRPNDAVITYCKLARSAYNDVPIVVGGIEGSLRRLAHYDYYKNKLRPSILLESGADLILYGMCENSIVELADSLNSGIPISSLTYLRGGVYKTTDKNLIDKDAIYLPKYEDLLQDKLNYARSYNIQYHNTDAINAKVLVEEYKEGYVVQNKPSLPLTKEEFDWAYGLNYERTYHPIYKEPVPAIDEVENSIIVNRGCYGSCSFCALSMHQGRVIQSRSKESVVKEAIRITESPNFKGYINDIGGPTANFYGPSCDKQEKYGACINKQCLHPAPCSNLKVDHKEYLDILRAVRSLPKIKKVFVRSGIRYDYLMYDKDDTFFNELIKYHVSGQLKVAPEHVSDNVLKYMQKPASGLYDKFTKKYEEINKKYGLKQFLVPYLMSSHPGSTLDDAIMLAEYIHQRNLYVEQVQDFYPTPMTLATCMYYTEVDPRDLKPVYVAKNPHEKALQRALIQYKNPHNYELVYEALVKAKRFDLIGYDKHCLIKPKKFNAHTPNKKDYKVSKS
jgi:uncharacterized radical SAM protein YgiQ